MTEEVKKTRALRGFAAMSPEKRREIARKGGASVPAQKRSFSKDRDLASEAGRSGGLKSVKPKGPRNKNEETPES